MLSFFLILSISIVKLCGKGKYRTIDITKIGIKEDIILPMHSEEVSEKIVDRSYILKKFNTRERRPN